MNMGIQRLTRKDSSAIMQLANGCLGRQLSQIGGPLWIRGIERMWTKRMERLNLNRYGQSEQSFDPVVLDRMKAESINNTKGDLTGYDCPACRNRGSIASVKDGGGLIFRECDCMRIRRCIMEMDKSGLGNIIREKTFEKYNALEPWQETIKDAAERYAENPSGWLVMCGQSGSGKTHLCTAVCRQRLLSGDVVRYFPWVEKIAEIKGMSLDDSRRADILHGYKTAQILYIDDLFKTGRAADGSCNPTQADVRLAYEIIDYRYRCNLPTIISTERTPLGLLEIDQATGGRINEMAGKNLFTIDTDMKRNYRLRDTVMV